MKHHAATYNKQLKGLRISLGIIFGLALTGLLAVTVTGTVNTFSSGALVKASEINTNFASLKTAIEGIVSSQWTTNGANIGYTAGSVGIGTTSPLRHFHIDGNNGVEQIIRNNSAASGSRTWGIIGNSGNLNIRTLNDDASVELSSVLNLTRTGNVGIGATSPGSKLTINQATGTNADGIRLVNGSVQNYLFSDAGGRFHIESNSNSNSLVVSTDGKIGLGTSVPASLLSINSSGAGNSQVFVKGQGTSSGTYTILATDSSSNNTFYVADDGAGYLKGTLTQNSDRRMKENIEYIPNGLNKITMLKPAKFDYIKGEKSVIGFIAQDVQKVIPEAVSLIHSEKDKGILGLKMDFIIPYLVNAIKELKTLQDAEKIVSDNRVLALEKENASVKAEGEQTFARLRESEKRIQQLEDRLRAVENKQLARK